MIIQCQSCAAKYFLPEEKIPANPLKVRCPKCRAVFMLAPRATRIPVGVAVGSAADATVDSAEMESAFTESAPPVAPEGGAAPSKGGRPLEDRAKRLARVLVSDILWYNRDKRDQALRDGTLMTTLGEEIKKSWELYKEKVGPETAHSTNYFKEALNEILANGQEVF